jgi:hypothetical protein
MSDPVNDGRDALDHWLGYPWYDAKTDGLRRVEVSQPVTINASLGTLLQWTAWFLVALLLAGIVYLLVRAFWRRDRRRAGETGAEPAGSAERIESLPAPAVDSPRDLLDEARRCQQRGDYGRAIVFLFSHQLWQLDKHGRIRLAQGKTNRQYLREIAARPALRSLMEQTTLVFENFFFGHHAIERPAFEICWSRLAEFDALVDEGREERGEGRGRS